MQGFRLVPVTIHRNLISSHLSLNRGGRWGTKDDFTTSFLHFFLFTTALWDLVNSTPVHSLMLSSHLFFCLPHLLPPFTVPCKVVLARPDERETCPCHLCLRLLISAFALPHLSEGGRESTCFINFLQRNNSMIEMWVNFLYWVSDGRCRGHLFT